MSYQQRFRQINDYANVHGFVGGFANFHQAKKSCSRVFGTLFVLPGQGVWRDVPASELGNPPADDTGKRFRATFDYAKKNGFAAGFPNFYHANAGKQRVYGTILLHKSAAVWRDVPAAELGNPPVDDVAKRFRATFDYAKRNGFAGGFPNFYHGDGAKGRVYGTILLRPGTVAWRDVLEDALNIFSSFTFDPAITRAQRATLLERHCFALQRVCGCGNLTAKEQASLLAAYRKPIAHGIETRANVNASAIINGSQIWVNFGQLFPQGDNEIAQTLIHEMMHCAGHTHPNRRDPNPLDGMSCAAPDPELFDCPFDNGQYYGTPPLRAELCIAGNQSDVGRAIEKANDEQCVINDAGLASIRSN